MRKFELRAHWPPRVAAAICTCVGVSGCTLDLPPPIPLDLTDATDTESGDTSLTVEQVSDTLVDSTNIDTSASSSGGDSGTGTDPGSVLDGSLTDSDVETDSGRDAEPAPGDTGAACSDGETLCGDVCMPVDECECGAPCELDNALAECRDGECIVVSCDEDFVDCDGLASNGCETSFALQPTAGQPIAVPNLPFQMPVDELSQQDWEAIPRFSLNHICDSCERNSRPPRVPAFEPASNRDIRPATTDFRATAAVAWNVAGIWLNLVVYDDRFIGAGDRAWAQDESADARWIDNFMVVWDNEAGPSSAGSGSDRIVFVGLDGATVNDWREQSLDGVTFAVEEQAQCRILNLRLSGDYLVDSGGSSPIDFQAGDQYGLAFGYNDFDPNPADVEAVTRQSLVFGVPMDMSPGDYFDGDRSLPQIELMGE